MPKQLMLDDGNPDSWQETGEAHQLARDLHEAFLDRLWEERRRQATEATDPGDGPVELT